MEKNVLCAVKLAQDKKTFRNEKGLLGQVSCTIPQCQQTRRKRAAKRINGFYKAFAHHIIRDARFRLQKDAQKEQDHELFLPFQTGVSSEITCQNGRLLCVVCDRTEKKAREPETIFRRSDLWDMNTGLPVLWADLFAGKPAKPRKILSVLREMADRHEHLKQSDWAETKRRLRQYFQKEQYYLTPDSLVFYYQPGTVAPPDKGVVVFPIPLDTLGMRLSAGQNETAPRVRRLRRPPQ